MNLRFGLIILSVVACLGLVNFNAFQREALADNGRVVYLKLAPVDPRSLLQGDYMQLNYATFPFGYDQKIPDKGSLVLKVDQQQIGQFDYFESDQQALAANQQRLKYRSKGYRIELATQTFFFQEGTGERFAQAQYAELRINEAGDMALVALRDADLKLIK